jgi:hypothetical protein
MMDASAGVPSTMMYLAESSPYLAIGNTQTGVAVAYLNCLSGSALLITVTYLITGFTPACELLSIVEDPAVVVGGVEITDCAFVSHYLTRGGQARINSDGSCDCNVATRQTSWGGIKALYRQ